MGAGLKKSKSVGQELDGVRTRVEERIGKLQVTGRYYIHPRKVEDDYEISKRELGTGANGAVYLATHRVNGTRVAVKPYSVMRISKAEMRVLRNEVEIFLSLDHPHVCRLVGVYEDTEQIQVVMECCEGGEILEYINGRGHFGEKDAAHLAYQMFLSVAYIHAQDVVHRDIKLQNFLFENKDYKQIKLIDFGFSRYWTTNKKMKLGCGTLSYMAPELLEGGYTNKCDIWSLGVCLYILLVGELPFGDGEEAKVTENIKKGTFDKSTPLWAKMSPDARDIISKLLDVNAETRPSAEIALTHPWIANREVADDVEHFDASIVDSLTKFAEASQFRKAAMTMMAYTLTAEERAGVREAFMEMDKDNTGHVALSELKEILASKCGAKDADAAKIFNSLSSNNHDRVNYSDFLAAMLASRIELNQNHLRSAFDRFDRDGSGVITIQNLRDVLGSTHNGVKVEELLAQADLDKSGKISFEEFTTLFQNDVANFGHQELADAVIESEHKRLNINTRQDAQNTPKGQNLPGMMPGQMQEGSACPANISNSLAPLSMPAQISEQPSNCVTVSSLEAEKSLACSDPSGSQPVPLATHNGPESRCCTIS
jgi:calcium-dependent protein kinase